MTVRRRHDIVVIGGGIAGLAAADAMRDLDPLVLEAGETVGGRVCTEDVAGVPMNLGAEYWVNAPCDAWTRALLDELGVDLVERSDDGRGGLVVGGHHAAVSTSDELAEVMGFADRARSDLHATRMRIAETLAALWSGEDRGLADRLMGLRADQWLGDIDPAVLQLYDDLACVTPGSHLWDLHALSFVVLLPAIGGTAEHQWGAEVIAGGSARLTAALASRLGTPPLTGAHVTGVVEVDGGVEITAVRDGVTETISARQVVLATPAPVTAAICHRLPDWKRAALLEAWYAPWSSVDLVLEADANAPWVGSGSVPFLEGPVSLLLDNGAVDDGRIAVRLLSGGVRALPHLDVGVDRLESLSRAHLAAVFPGCDRVVGSTARLWTAGAPHFQWGRPYGTRANIRALMASVGPLHFCGDYMGFLDAEADGGFGAGDDVDYRTTTYMTTALRTGRRGAEAVRTVL